MKLSNKHFLINADPMKLRKGMILVFKNRTEVIQKASNNIYTGEIVTDKQTYSTDFIIRWIHAGFVKLKT